MSRNSSIGYIPPTPFRDDSDVFLVSPEQLNVTSPQQEADTHSDHVLAELEVLTGLRTEIRQRHHEIMSRFQGLLKDFSRDAVPRTKPLEPRTQVAFTLPPAAPALSIVSETQPESTTQQPVRTVPKSDPKFGPLAPSPAPASEPVEGEGDRLAALKAQLANRLKAMKGSSQSIDILPSRRGGEA